MNRSIRVLAGDIGGTKTLLQLAEFIPGAPQPQQILREQRFDSAAYGDLAPMVQQFLTSDDAPIHSACFGIAGPVSGDRKHQKAHLTNLPWRLDSRRLAAETGIPVVRFINDFEAVGIGIEALEPADVVVLNDQPECPHAPRVVLGAGTGLGVALLVPCEGHFNVLPTEAGHMDFAGSSPTHDGLLAFLRAEFGHVSWERVVSGPGLVNIYRYLLQRDGIPAANAPYLASSDAAAAIAGASADARAAEAMDIFCGLYGAMAGNLALGCLAYGGIYLAGGIAAKILPHLQRDAFAHSYRDKGRMAPLVEAMAVKVVTNPNVGLLGALLAASRL